MAPTALAYTYCTEADIEALLSVDGKVGRVDDDNNGSLSATESGYITKAINWATARLNMYLAPIYAQADLATDWVVNEWCVILACHWLSIRRGNPAPGSFVDQMKSVMEDIKLVRQGTVVLDLGQREGAWPAWSNVRVDMGYPLRKIRVERPISEQPTLQPQNQDLAANHIPAPW